MDLELSKRILNQVFEIGKKSKKNSFSVIDRNLANVFSEFEQEGFFVENPEGQAYDERRTDYQATIVGDQMHRLVITEVMKPIIYLKTGSDTKLVQKGVVIAEEK